MASYHTETRLVAVLPPALGPSDARGAYGSRALGFYRAAPPIPFAVFGESPINDKQEKFMAFNQQLECALSELEDKGIKRSTAYPPIYRVLHKLGVKARLPQYTGFGKNFIIFGLFFGVFWGLFMYVLATFFLFVKWPTAIPPEPTLAIASLGAGLLFGLTMALYFKVSASRHKLGGWPRSPSD